MGSYASIVNDVANTPEYCRIGDSILWSAVGHSVSFNQLPINDWMNKAFNKIVDAQGGNGKTFYYQNASILNPLPASGYASIQNNVSIWGKVSEFDVQVASAIIECIKAQGFSLVAPNADQKTGKKTLSFPRTGICFEVRILNEKTIDVIMKGFVNMVTGATDKSTKKYYLSKADDFGLMAFDAKLLPSEQQRANLKSTPEEDNQDDEDDDDSNDANESDDENEETTYQITLKRE